MVFRYHSQLVKHWWGGRITAAETRRLGKRQSWRLSVWWAQLPYDIVYKPANRALATCVWTPGDFSQRETLPSLCPIQERGIARDTTGTRFSCWSAWDNDTDEPNWHAARSQCCRFPIAPNTHARHRIHPA